MSQTGCNLTISSISGAYNQATSVYDVTIHGTAVSCSIVDIKILCNNGFVNDSSTHVDQYGLWSITMRTQCRCDIPITVNVTCENNNSCTATFTGIIPCTNINNNPSCCPVFTFKTEFGPCVDGIRSVRVNYTVYPTSNPNCNNVYRGKLEFQGISLPPILFLFPPDSPVTGSVIFNLPIGTHQSIALQQTNQNGFVCSDVSQSFLVPGCDPPTNCCPSAIVKKKIRDCNTEYSRRHMLVKADIVSPCNDPIDARMEIEGILIASGSSANGSLTLQGEGDFTCGHHDVIIKVSDCPDITGDICVPDCESTDCRFKRLLVLTSLGSAAILWILFAVNAAIAGVLFSQIHVQNILLWYAIIATIAVILTFIAWLSCLKNCANCKLWLLFWQFILVLFCEMIILSKGFVGYLASAYSVSGFWPYLLLILVYIIVLLLLLLAFYLIMNYWKSICCPRKCDVMQETLFCLFIGFGTGLTVALSIPAIHAWEAPLISVAAGIYTTWYLVKVFACREVDQWE